MNSAPEEITSPPQSNPLPGTPRKPPHNLSHDPPPNLSLDPPLNPSNSPTPSLGERLRDIFPPGLESNSKSTSQSLYYFPSHHFHRILTENYGRNRHVEHTIVKSAWYGKQKKSAKHEFIIIQVEDLAIPELKNYIALDRNQRDPPSSPGGNVSAVSSRTNAIDAFRVSYDGDLRQFLRECQLTNYRKLEQIDFQPEEPLLLLNLVILVNHISERHPKYNVIDTNCYWFTRLVWDCMRGMCPKAGHSYCARTRRGDFGCLRCVTNPRQARKVLRILEVGNKFIGLANSGLPQTGNQSHPTNYEGESIAMTTFYEEEVMMDNTGGTDDAQWLMFCSVHSARH